MPMVSHLKRFEKPIISKRKEKRLNLSIGKFNGFPHNKKASATQGELQDIKRKRLNSIVQNEENYQVNKVYKALN